MTGQINVQLALIKNRFHLSLAEQEMRPAQSVPKKLNVLMIMVKSLTMTGRFKAGYSSINIELTDASSDRNSILLTPNVDFINGSSTLYVSLGSPWTAHSSIVSPSSQSYIKLYLEKSISETLFLRFGVLRSAVLSSEVITLAPTWFTSTLCKEHID